MGRALARRGRLSTPARRRAAFLHHFSHCRTVVEAAARTGVDRRTVDRWRRACPAFGARFEQIVADRRREAFENVVLAADLVEMQPVYYRGAKVGEYPRRDRALGLYLLKQADAAALREELRRDAAAFEARVAREVAREVERRMAEMSRSAGHEEEEEDDDDDDAIVEELNRRIEASQRLLQKEREEREERRKQAAGQADDTSATPAPVRPTPVVAPPQVPEPATLLPQVRGAQVRAQRAPVPKAPAPPIRAQDNVPLAMPYDRLAAPAGCAPRDGSPAETVQERARRLYRDDPDMAVKMFFSKENPFERKF
jgi:hypothetical protein